MFLHCGVNAWLGVNQNYLRDDTLSAANAILVAAQNKVPWLMPGVAAKSHPADGMRFVVPVRTVTRRTQSEILRLRKGITWY